MLALSQLNLAILPSILPSVGIVDPINLLKTETAKAQQEEALQIEVPQLVVGVASIVEIQQDKAFTVKKVESRAEAKARKAKEAKQARKARAHAGSGNCEDYRSLVAKYFPANQVNNALYTMKKESGCRANAISDTNDHGLMQINYRWHAAKVNHNINRLYDPETNIRIASDIWKDSGWRAWYAVQGELW